MEMSLLPSKVTSRTLLVLCLDVGSAVVMSFQAFAPNFILGGPWGSTSPNIFLTFRTVSPSQHSSREPSPARQSPEDNDLQFDR